MKTLFLFLAQTFKKIYKYSRSIYESGVFSLLFKELNGVIKHFNNKKALY